ncbi:hypothetical protein [Acidicapsa ligni]|uniref:hypothetical protein n=1 Tax=Acidicapsa ligni TaxID=542300 RepID=UPI0021DF9871|nr:hypothetical protein [Acidicapsa ligni]
MKDLLHLAVEAHGGLAQWNSFSRLEADASIGGALWHLKGRPDVLKNIHVSAELHEQWISTLLLDSDHRLTLAAGDIVLESGSDEGRRVREQPREAFAGQLAETPWDDFHVGYFSNYALWTYFTIPFLFTYPGFVTQELEPWYENNEVWRPLQVIFPSNIASHTHRQISYFGPDGLLRRHEYTVDVLGSAKGVNYALGYREVNGIQIPTQRRVFACDDSKQKIPVPLLVSIDLTNIRLT